MPADASCRVRQHQRTIHRWRESERVAVLERTGGGERGSNLLGVAPPLDQPELFRAAGGEDASNLRGFAPPFRQPKSFRAAGGHANPVSEKITGGGRCAGAGNLSAQHENHLAPGSQEETMMCPSIPRHISLIVVTALIAVVASNGFAWAALDPGAACAIAKQKAAAKVLTQKIKCYGVAQKLGVDVDPECLASADAKLNAMFAKAESVWTCTTVGNLENVRSIVNSAVAQLLATIPAELTNPYCPINGTCPTNTSAPACVTCMAENAASITCCTTAIETLQCSTAMANQACSVELIEYCAVECCN